MSVWERCFSALWEDLKYDFKQANSLQPRKRELFKYGSYNLFRSAYTVSLFVISGGCPPLGVLKKFK